MSQLDSESTQIAGRTFVVYKLPPLEAQDVLIDIVQTLVPAAPEIAQIVAGQDGGSEADIVSVLEGNLLAKVIGGLRKDQMRELVRVMKTVSHCDGKDLGQTFDIVFRGDLPSMYKWLGFCLKVQFGNFSGLAQNVLSQAARVGEPQPKSPSTSKDGTH